MGRDSESDSVGIAPHEMGSLRPPKCVAWLEYSINRFWVSEFRFMRITTTPLILLRLSPYLNLTMNSHLVLQYWCGVIGPNPANHIALIKTLQLLYDWFILKDKQIFRMVELNASSYPEKKMRAIAQVEHRIIACVKCLCLPRLPINRRLKVEKSFFLIWISKDREFYGELDGHYV